MNDLVHRLRGRKIIDAMGGITRGPTELEEEAANEIERLNDALAQSGSEHSLVTAGVAGSNPARIATCQCEIYEHCAVCRDERAWSDEDFLRPEFSADRHK